MRYAWGMESSVGLASPPVRSVTGRDLLLASLASIALMLACLAPAVIVFGVRIALRKAATLSSEDLLLFTTLGLLAEAVGLIAAVWWFGKRRRKLSWREFGFRPVSANWVLVSIGLTFAVSIIGGALGVLVQQGFGLPGENPQIKALAPAGFSWPAAIGVTLLGGVLVPIAEEMFFRGMLHRWARDKWGFAAGALISAIVFGAIHVIPLVIPFAILMGLAASWAYERTGSLLPGLIIHVINNTVKIALVYAVLAR